MATRVQQMKTLIQQARADGKVTFKEADAIAQQAVKGNLSRGVLQQAKDFFDDPKATAESNAKGVDSTSGGNALMQVLYWGMPRHLGGNGGSGQTFKEGLTMNSTEYFFGDRPKEPLTFEVHGTAKKNYTLKFKIAETQFSVPVKKGETASVVASHIAKAVNVYAYNDGNNPKAQEFGDAAGKKGAMSWPDSDSYPIGISARAKSGVVYLSPTIDS